MQQKHMYKRSTLGKILIKPNIGYLLDGVARTVQLPPDWAEDLLKEVRAVLKKQRVQLT